MPLNRRTQNHALKNLFEQRPSSTSANTPKPVPWRGNWQVAPRRSRCRSWQGKREKPPPSPLLLPVVTGPRSSHLLISPWHHLVVSSRDITHAFRSLLRLLVLTASIYSVQNPSSSSSSSLFVHLLPPVLPFSFASTSSHVPSTIRLPFLLLASSSRAQPPQTLSSLSAPPSASGKQVIYPSLRPSFSSGSGLSDQGN